MITLTSAGPPDLSAVHSWADFAQHLDGVHRRTGKSLTDLEKIGKRLPETAGRLRDLPKSTVSDALRGRRPVKKDLLESLLKAWQVPDAEQAQVISTWQRLNASVGQGPANACRVDETSLRELGVHPAISSDGGHDDLPLYVQRDFDDKLRNEIAEGVDRGCFVLLVGGSSWGKTRSLGEAVRVIVPDWWLVQPAKTEDIHDLLAAPTERTVLWLDELQRYLGADPPLLREHLVTLVRTTGMIVVGTLWPNSYFRFKRLPAEGDDVRAEARLIDYATVISVPNTFSEEERRRAKEIAAVDSRIKNALSVSDAGVTQVLAAAPDLVTSWEQAPDPYSKAAISATAEARRLGVLSPLPAVALAGAMVDYLTPAERVAPFDAWLDRALTHATGRLHGAVSALSSVAGEEPGSVAGYVVADYLAQHIGKVHRAECPPDSLWTALLTHVRNENDLRRLADAAHARMRYGYAEQVLRRLHRTGDRTASVHLVALLRRQDRLGEAIATVEEWRASAPTDKQPWILRAELIRIRARAEQLRQRASDDARAEELLVEVLADGGRADTLRVRAAAGDVVALEDLAELLADRGCLDELRSLADGGHPVVLERLADLLRSLGRKAELRQRAESGDPVAALHVERLYARETDGPSEEVELRQLRDASADPDAAAELLARLFDDGDREALLAEVNAGTPGAAGRYLALLTADSTADRGTVRRIRQFGLGADGSPGGAGLQFIDARRSEPGKGTAWPTTT
ncbi:hypothetical protein [Amycolatopsis sp. NPDC003861]